MSVSKMSVSKMSVSKMSVSKMSVSKMSVSKMSVNQIFVGKMSVNQIVLDQRMRHHRIYKENFHLSISSTFYEHYLQLLQNKLLHFESIAWVHAFNKQYSLL
jgi:hypothetical protein